MLRNFHMYNFYHPFWLFFSFLVLISHWKLVLKFKVGGKRCCNESFLKLAYSLASNFDGHLDMYVGKQFLLLHPLSRCVEWNPFECVWLMASVLPIMNRLFRMTLWASEEMDLCATRPCESVSPRPVPRVASMIICLSASAFSVLSSLWPIYLAFLMLVWTALWLWLKISVDKTLLLWCFHFKSQTHSLRLSMFFIGDFEKRLRASTD